MPIRRLLLAALAAALLSFPAAVSAGQPAPHRAFAPVLAKLDGGTQTPLVLPSVVPGVPARQVHAFVERLRARSYSIVLGFVPDCAGGTACRIGTVAGALGRRPALLRGRRVVLAGGSVGWWRPATCGANCSDGELSFARFGGTYTFGIKAGRLGEVRRMAESALRVGPVSAP